MSSPHPPRKGEEGFMNNGRRVIKVKLEEEEFPGQSIRQQIGVDGRRLSGGVIFLRKTSSGECFDAPLGGHTSIEYLSGQSL